MKYPIKRGTTPLWERPNPNKVRSIPFTLETDQDTLGILADERRKGERWGSRNLVVSKFHLEVRSSETHEDGPSITREDLTETVQTVKHKVLFKILVEYLK